MNASYNVAYRRGVTHSTRKLRISKNYGYKLYYFAGGEGEMSAFVDGSLVDVLPGQVLLIPEGSFSGIIKKHHTRYARCVSLFPRELESFLAGASFGVAELLRSPALFTLDEGGVREFGEIIASISEKVYGIEALEIIIRELRILEGCDRRTLGARSGDKLLSEVLDVIDGECLTLGTADEIAERVGYSTNYLSKYFKANMNIGLHDFLIARKLFAALEMLTSGASVTDAAYAAGFSGASHFISLFKAHYGETPKKYISKIVEN